MLPPPDIFDPARTHCPSCNATLSALADSCAFCSFSAQICVRRYPFTPPSLERFVDPDREITSRARRQMESAIRRLEKRFPQITVSVCNMRLPENVDGREFGYWYLNASEPANEAERARRPHHLLLLVDRASNQVSVTVSYGLDCFLDDQFLYRTLEQTSHAFRTRGYAAGISAWLNLVSSELIPIQKEAKYAAERWQREELYRPEPETADRVSGGQVDVVGSAPPIAQKPRDTGANFTTHFE